nr:PQQ-dependent catabolism-associated CXXCW motif protein [Rubellimicrobium aerolatum]
MAEPVPEPEGFRDAPYRAPVPEGLAGATTVGTEEAFRLWEEGRTVFVDALPRDERPADLPVGTIWRDAPHDSIPGAVWLPNTGYARLPPKDEVYLREGLERIAGGDPARPILFFCKEECWMSWNAAKRALSWGYRAVHWYPGGTDGWTRAGHPLEPVEPLERP